ncbi:hypothetical protein M2322_000409 [Rhodoblastus acidophilus]|uniref:hypothetical protein n=1 Tax=Rhodoblastus acidophilus TaxID=1074 RepID=UPI00222475AA|nr:hypothetical protein [Rhodoblastus acidophilus]MCW2314889.1 hypothetical protein [Rhodoblastus acidophilus]
MRANPNCPTRISLRYPDLNQSSSQTAVIVERHFSDELAVVLRKLIAAGRWGVSRDEIPDRIIPRLYQNGFAIQFFIDPRYAFNSNPSDPKWARLLGADNMEIVGENH